MIRATPAIWTRLPRPGRFPLGAIIAAMMLSGCANVLQGAGGGTGEAGAGGPGSGLYDHTSGAEDVLVSIAIGGGFVPVEFNLRNTPDFLLLGDGTAIAGGVMIAIYPGPAIAPLQSAALNEGQIQALLAAADNAGLLAGEIDFGEPAVTDLPNTTVTITVDGHIVTQSAYALGFNDDPSSGLSADQIAARSALQGFIDAAHATVDSASAGYQPTGVVAYRINADGFSTPDDPELPQPAQTWPISTAPADPTAVDSAATCLVVTGAEATTLLLALATANELTPWLIGTDPPAHMVFRPYLPGDPGCE